MRRKQMRFVSHAPLQTNFAWQQIDEMLITFGAMANMQPQCAIVNANRQTAARSHQQCIKNTTTMATFHKQTFY